MSGGIRSRYAELFRAHRETLAAQAGRQGWRFTTHRTDGTPELALLGLMGMLAPAHGELTMLNFGLLAFAQPWLLVAGLALPALWLLLRVTPPAPRRIAFPPFLLLAKLVSPERTPARTPWWLLLLRLVIAALLIVALAGPVLNPAPRLGGSGPLAAGGGQWLGRREALGRAHRRGPRPPAAGRARGTRGPDPGDGPQPR